MKRRFRFPARFQQSVLAPSIGVDVVREMVAGAPQQELSIDRTAVEILSRVAGATLKPAHVNVLLDIVDQQLAAVPPPEAANSGPLSQTDVLGAILGIAHFLLHMGGEWLFASIPYSSSSSPDLYALRPGGRPWFIELKGIAPLASSVKARAKLDVCGKVRARVADGVAQLRWYRGGRGDGPAIRVRGGLLLRDAMQGGRALSAIVLPDGFLGDRHDLLPVNGKACPQDRRCAEQCLRSHLPAYRTSLVGLLWTAERAAAGSGRSDGTDEWSRCLAAVETLNLALWAGSKTVADQALGAVAQRAGALNEDAAARDRLVLRALRASRNMTSRESRRDAVRALSVGRQERLAAEADFSYDEPPRTATMSALFEGELSPNAELEVRSDGYFGIARLSNGRLRVAPSLAMYDAAMETGEPRRLLDLASTALQRNVLAHLYGDMRDLVALEDVTVASGDARTVVGREAWTHSVPAEFGPLPPSAHRAWGRALRGDAYTLHDFVHEWEPHFSPRRGSWFCDWADLAMRYRRFGFEPDLWPGEARSSWAGLDGTMSVAV